METIWKLKLRQRTKSFLLFVFMVVACSVLIGGAGTTRIDGDGPVHHCVDNSRATLESTEIEITGITFKETPMLFQDVDYIKPINKNDATKQIETNVSYIDSLKTEITDDNYTNDAVAAMETEITRLENINAKLQSDITKFDKWYSEHYYATCTWFYLRERGFSEAVTSAIIGNMMVETSGGSLNIEPIHYSRNGLYYGLCQWSLKYRPYVADMSFEDQLDYLVKDMPSTFKTYGKIYKSGFTYQNFLDMDDPREIALAFAKVYERCGSGSYTKRGNCAMKVYNYYVGSNK